MKNVNRRHTMKSLHTLLYTLSIILFAVACHSKQENRGIPENIEEVTILNPDSAVAILDNIEYDRLGSKGEKMRYTLLQTLICDAKGKALPGDTILRTLCDYYNSNDVTLHFLSLYTLGRYYQKTGHNSKAILEYTRAEQLIDKLDNPLYCGLLYRNLGLLFTESLDYSRALTLYNNAYLYFNIADNSIEKHNTAISISQVLIELKRYDEAEEYLLNELQWGYENGCKEVSQNCIDNLLKLYSRTYYYTKADWLLGSEYAEGCDTTQIVNLTLAYLYAADNNMKKSNEHMRRAWRNATTINDTLSNLTQMYDISRMTGDKENALYILENIHYIHDTIMRSALRQPLLKAQSDYYQSQIQLGEYRLANTKRMATVIVVIVVLLLCVAMLVMQNRITAKNIQIERYAEAAEEINKSLYAKSAAYDDISNRLETRNAHIIEMDKQVSVLFKKQFELLNELSGTFYETHGIKKDKEAIYRQVRENIESFMKDKKEIQHLESIVNNYRGDIINKMRSQLPQLGEQEIRFIVFICAGFSPKAISIFMEESVGNIYTKKSRIKSYISRSDAPEKELFIDALS
ncbi:MAG: hypothetical protein IKD40_06270 [Bacteroidaceae bacterium]|nr:hypothetical protein [Bacteroidaceae bacterium]